MQVQNLVDEKQGIKFAWPYIDKFSKFSKKSRDCQFTNHCRKNITHGVVIVSNLGIQKS